MRAIAVTGGKLIFDKGVIDHAPSTLAYPLAMYSNAPDVTFSNCIFKSGYKNNLCYITGGGKLTLYNNIFMCTAGNQPDSGIFFGYSTASTIVACNNIFIGPSSKPIFSGVATLVEDYNIYINTVSISSNSADGANDINAASLLSTGVSAYQTGGLVEDFRVLKSLQTNGTTSFNGVDLTTWDSGRLMTDIDGRTRSIYAIGATEGYRTASDLNDIIKSAGGNYDDDNLIDANVKDGIDYGLSSTGSLVEDYPAETDVRNGVQYNSAVNEGTAAIPAPANVRETVPVDATVGTLHVPSVSEDDVRDGTTF